MRVIYVQLNRLMREIDDSLGRFKVPVVDAEAVEVLLINHSVCNVQLGYFHRKTPIVFQQGGTNTT